MTLEPEHMGQVRGLCGNFDANQENDFMARNGALEPVADNFANTWKLSAGCPEVLLEEIPHPCDVSMDVKERAFSLGWCP